MKALRALYPLLAVLMLNVCLYGQNIRLGVPYGHTSGVNKVLFGPNNNYILSSSQDGTMNIWRRSDGLLIYNIRNSGVSGSITNDAEFSPDGEHMMLVSSDSTVKVYDFIKGELVHELKGQSAIHKTTYSPDGKYILSSADECILWDAESGEQIRTVQSGYKISGRFLKGSGLIAINSGYHKGNRVEVYSLNGSLLHSFKIYSKAFFSPDGAYVVSSSYNAGIVGCWELESGKNLYRKLVHREMIRDISFNANGSSFASSAYVNKTKVFETKTGKLLGSVNPKSFMVFTSAISPDAKEITTYTFSGLESWDIATGQKVRQIQGLPGEILDLKYSEDGKYLLAGSASNKAMLWDIEQDIAVLELQSNLLEITAMATQRKGSQLAVAFSDSTVRLLNPENGKFLKEIHLASPASQLVLGVDGRSILIQQQKYVLAYDLVQEKEKYRLGGVIQHASYDGKTATLLEDGRVISQVEINSGKSLRQVISKDFITDAFFSENGKYLVSGSSSWKGSGYVTRLSDGKQVRSFKNSSGKWKGVDIYGISPDSRAILLREGTLKLVDIQDGSLLECVADQGIPYRSIGFDADGSIVAIGRGKHIAKYNEGSVNYGAVDCLEPTELLSIDGSEVSGFIQNPQYEVALSDFCALEFRPQDANHRLRMMFFSNGDWICLSEEGFFDASKDAMTRLYWLQGNEVIDFDQLKHRYWIPGLAQKIMDGEPLPQVKSVGKIKLEPLVELGEIEQGLLPVKLSKRSGGYGDISLFINGKEVAKDILPAQVDTSQDVIQFTYDISAHPYLRHADGGQNKISVAASSADDFVQGKGVVMEYMVEEDEGHEPNFYAIVLGVSDYINQSINLRYTTQDAEAISTAVGLGAKELFGSRSHIYSLHSESAQRPTKTAIKALFDSVSRQAKAEDIILVYLSGHGVNYGGTFGDFYFLTADAISSRASDYSDEFMRQNQAISTAEITEWLKSIAALKQVMIIDACGSGKAVENLLASRNVEASQIRAMDRMKDRTGMFIISGCAADAVSYEASRYGQGLLTYALLQAMKGAALKENRFVDVNTIFQYAREEVPVLAKDIQGIQEPQLLIPSSGSFDIGILRPELQAQIPLNQVKPIFVRSMFLDADALKDVLQLSQEFDAQLEDFAYRGEVDLVFRDVTALSDGNRISGIYQQVNDTITLACKYSLGTDEYVFEFTAQSKEALVKKVYQQLEQLL